LGRGDIVKRKSQRTGSGYRKGIKYEIREGKSGKAKKEKGSVKWKEGIKGHRKRRNIKVGPYLLSAGGHYGHPFKKMGGSER